MSASTLFVLVGEPGCGKSTLASNLARYTHSTIVSSDAIRAELWGSEDDQRNAGLVFDVAETRVDDLLGSSKSVVLDATNVRPEWRERFLAVAEKHGARKVAFVYNGATEIAIARNHRRDRKVPDRVIWAMAEARKEFDGERFDAVYNFK